MLETFEIQVPAKNENSIKNMELSFVLRITSYLPDLDSARVGELKHVVEARESFEANPNQKTLTVIYADYEYTITRDALCCDCGKGLLCPFVAQKRVA